ncbi:MULTISPECIES: peptidoglycan-binding domain-containing protein [unclassified Microcoleus]|uniref:peptidoglycan-binding domain-containing protein n=1 Tax=unclassified Microcoleus TaxID=2642155 RepID=UPI002FD3A49C
MAGSQTFYYLLAVLALLVLTGTSRANSAAGSAACYTDDCHRPAVRHHKRILKCGSKGEDVKRLQKLLNARDFSRHPIVIDGVFGPTTEDAVKRFQRQAHIPVDGVVGGTTWDRLLASL